MRAAYRRLALQWHPDKNQERQELAEAKFKRVTGAYHLLTTVNFDFERCVCPSLPVAPGAVRRVKARSLGETPRVRTFKTALKGRAARARRLFPKLTCDDASPSSAP